MREIMREISVASSEAFASVVTEQTTGGKVWDAAVHLLGYLEAHPHYLVGRPAVLECGAGTGWLGMSLAARHDLSEMVLTEMVQGGALRWLDYNVQRNRDAGVPLTTVRTAALDWAWMDQGAHQGGLQSLSKELLQELMHDEAKLQQFLAENPSMMEEIMALL